MQTLTINEPSNQLPKFWLDIEQLAEKNQYYSDKPSDPQNIGFGRWLWLGFFGNFLGIATRTEAFCAKQSLFAELGKKEETPFKILLNKKITVIQSCKNLDEIKNIIRLTWLEFQLNELQQNHVTLETDTILLRTELEKKDTLCKDQAKQITQLQAQLILENQKREEYLKEIDNLKKSNSVNKTFRKVKQPGTSVSTCSQPKSESNDTSAPLKLHKAISGKAAGEFLIKHGFAEQNGKGSHRKYQKNGKIIVIPIHDTALKPDLIAKINKQLAE